MDQKIHFIDIPKVIENACENHKKDLNIEPSLDEVLAVDSWARQIVRENVQRGTRQIKAS